MKLRTFLIAPILTFSLAYIGAKGYVHYKTKANMDKMVRLASPIVQIDYSDVGSRLISGTLYIDNLRISPTETYDEVTIERLSISGKSFNFLIDMARGFKSNQPPSQITIAFEKLEAPVSGGLFSRINSSIYGDKSQIEFETCSIPGILNATGLQELDMTSITANGTFGYTYDKSASQATINIKYDIAGVESTLVDIGLSQLTAEGVVGIGKLPVVEEIRIKREYERNYLKQIINYCATDYSLATTAFIDDLFTQSDDYYLESLGFIPGPGLSKLFKQLITSGGVVEISASPSSEISPDLLKAYRPEDLADLFGVTASYNSTPINDLSFSMQSSTAKQSKKSTAKGTTESTQNPAVSSKSNKSTRLKPKSKLRYLETDISTLNDYKYHQVRAYTLADGRPKQGTLISIANNKINIEQLMFGGKMTSHIEISRIERIEVLRREEPEDK